MGFAGVPQNQIDKVPRKPDNAAWLRPALRRLFQILPRRLPAPPASPWAVTVLLTYPLKSGDASVELLARTRALEAQTSDW
jgi:hypothetical protein